MSITFFYNRLSFYILVIFVLMLFIQLCIHWFRFSKLAFFKKKPRPKLDDELEPVSVVVCARDSYEQLTELIPALLTQNYPQFEIVIVNDCSEDETEEYLKDLERREPRIKCVQLRQHLNFFNGKKFPLSMGIKSASHDLLVLTDADCLPSSEEWLRSMVSCYNPDTEVVLGYARYRANKRITNKLIRYDALQTGMIYLSAALAGHPSIGTGKNLSYRKSLFFKNKGFTSHYTRPAGDDDVFINQVATKKNTRVCIDAENSITATPTSSFWTWVRQRCNKYSTIKLHRTDTRAMMALHYWSQFLFYGCFVALFFLKPAFGINSDIPYYGYYFPTLAALFLLRYLTQLILYRATSRRLGEHGLLPGLIIWDTFFAVATPLFRITGRMTKE